MDSYQKNWNILIFIPAAALSLKSFFSRPFRAAFEAYK